MSYDESTVIAELPPPLQSEVALFLKKDIIERVPMFQGASDEFIKEIALKMNAVVFTPGDYVYRKGESARDMYFVSRGVLEVLSEDGERVYAKMTVGDFFGEIALMSGQRRTASVRAVSYCDLYRLDRQMFEQVLASYPAIAEQIRAKAQERAAR